MTPSPCTEIADLHLEAYDRATDRLLWERRLKPVPMRMLEGIFDNIDDPEMCNAYPVRGAELALLTRFLDELESPEGCNLFVVRRQ